MLDYRKKSNTKLKILNKNSCTIIILLCMIFLFLLSSEVNADQSFGDLYKLDGIYITNVLPQTTVKDLRNNLEIEDAAKMQVTDKNGIIKNDNELVGSGMILKLEDDTYKISVVGDVDGNGKITITDLVKVQLNLVNLTQLEKDYEKSLDLNNDGNISITDLTKLNLSILRLIDFVAPNSFVPTVTSTMDSITVSGETVDEDTGISEYYFKINNENWVQNEDKTKSTYTFTNLDKNTSYKVKMKVKDQAGNEKITQSIKISTAECNIHIYPEIQEWTNEDIHVGVEYNSGNANVKKIISIDEGKTFEEYIGPVTIRNNTEIVARIVNESNEIIAEARKIINNIDKLQPNDISITATADKNTIFVEAQAQDNQADSKNGTSGIKQYEYIIERNFWSWRAVSEKTYYTFNNLIEGETYTVKVLAVDNAGNKAESEELEIKLKTKSMLEVNPNGGIWQGSEEVQEFKQWEGETKIIENPEREGFIFEGWEVEGEKNLNDGIYTYGQKNTTITAKWKQVQFVYVTLYADGTLGFSNTADTIEEKEILHNYGDIYEKIYTINLNENQVADYTYVQPWYDNRDRITKVDFASEIMPKTTACWFFECSNLETINNIQNLNTSKVTNMNWMFRGCEKITELDVSKFDTSNVTSMKEMFYGCKQLINVDVSGFDTSNVTDMEAMFRGCENLVSVDTSRFDTSNVTTMKGMFKYCKQLTNVDVSGFDTSNVTDMDSMFGFCGNLVSVDTSNFDTSNVTTVNGMFYDCSSLTNLNLSNFNTSNVVDMIAFFKGCSGLTSIDVSSFDTSNVTNMKWMFRNCSGLTSLDVSNFDTSNVTNFWDMFFGCSSLIKLDLSNFDTSNVTDMREMFYGCSSLIELDVSNFDTSNVTSMVGIFNNCSSLTTLDLSSFDTSNVTNMKWMFRNCNNLTIIYVGENWKIASESNEMFNGCGTNSTTIK